MYAHILPKEIYKLNIIYIRHLFEALCVLNNM